MKSIKRKYPVPLFAAICAAVSLSSIFPAGAESLTLDAARNLALSNSKTLASLNLSADSAAIDEKIQKYESLPSISASASTSVSNPSASASSVSDTLSAKASIGITQTVFNGGKNSTLEAIDKLSSGIARENARLQYYSVLDAIDAAWFGLAEAAASRDAAAAALATSELSLSIAETRMDSGAISMPDYLQAEADAESKRTALSQAKRDASIYSMKLASLTGLSVLPEIAASDYSSYEPLIAKLAAYSDEDTQVFISKIREKTLASNPSLVLASQTSARAAKSVSLASAAYFPTVTASASGGVDYTAPGGAGDPTASLSIAANLSLDAWKTKASVDKAELARKQAALSAEETKRTVDIDLQTAALNCLSAARSVVSSGKALDYAQKHYESKFELYKLGGASVSDVSDAETLVGTNMKSLISARYEFLSCLSKIRSLAACDSDAETLELIP